MRYRIGELADLFGMTKEGVRYLERQGIIRSERDAENGYRYFSREEIIRLKQIRRYQGFGFSLEEAKRLVCETPKEDILEKLAQKQRELSETAKQIERMQQFLSKQQEVATRLLHAREQIWLGERPEMIFFPRVPEEASGATPEERRAIVRARAQEKEWILATPMCTLGAMHRAADGSGPRQLGSIVRAEDARAAGMQETERTIHLMPCPCICGVLEAPDKRPPDLSPVLAYAQAHGLQIVGDIYGALWFTCRAEQGGRYTIHEIYAPYKPA